MIIIYITIVGLIFYILGFFIGQNDAFKQTKDLLVSNQIKYARLKMIIKSHRNMLLREEERLKALPKEEQKNNTVNYVDVKAKLKLIRQIEGEIANEV